MSDIILNSLEVDGVTAKLSASGTLTGLSDALVDPTLSISGMAADAKVTGDNFAELNTHLNDTDDLLRTTNFYAYYGASLGLINENGEVEPNSKWYTVNDFIPVTAGKSYTFKDLSSDENFSLFYAFYDSTQTFISREVVTVIAPGLNVTIPDGVSYLKCSVLDMNLSFALTSNRLDDIEASITGVSSNVGSLAEQEKEDVFNTNELLNANNYAEYFGWELGLLQDGVVVQNTKWYTIKGYVPVYPGKTIRVTVDNDEPSQYMFYAIYDSTKTYTSGGTIGIQHTYDFPNTGSSVIYVKVCFIDTSYQDVSVAYTETAIERLDAGLSQIGDTVGSLVNKTKITNNLVSDGLATLPVGCEVYKNGTADPTNYGDDNVKYVMTLPDYDLLHLYFEYQYSEAIPYFDNNTILSLFSLGENAAVEGREKILYSKQYSGNVGRFAYLMGANAGTQYSYEMTGEDIQRVGNKALWVKYEGTVTSSTVVRLMFGDNSIEYVVNGTTVATVTYTDNESITSLSEKLNDLTDLSSGVYETFGSCADLLIQSGQYVNLFGSYKNNSNQTIYEAYKVAIPFAHDKKWHTIETVVYRSAQKAYIAFDGQTVEVSLHNSAKITDNTCVIGGDFNGSESPIRLRNLEIDVNSSGDAEVVHAPASSPFTTSQHWQIVSNHNPRVMIFEGHGIIVGTEEYAQTLPSSDDQMAVSTDRLQYVFRELERRGYVPVSINDIYAWKYGRITLPKRCYGIVFDDYRIENYLDYDKRKPFIDNNVFPSLALISDQHALDETVTVNSQTYTIEQALSMIHLAGWGTCSHTHDHRRSDNYSQVELIDLYKADVLSCNAKGIGARILVYPFGVAHMDVFSALSESDFGLGINITLNALNTKLRSPASLSRTEIGTREPIENVLDPFV